MPMTESLMIRAEQAAKDIKTTIIDEFKNLKTVEDETASNEYQLEVISESYVLLEVIDPCCIVHAIDRIGVVEYVMSLKMVNDNVKTDGPFAQAFLSCFNNTSKINKPKVDAIIMELQGRNN